MRLILSVLLAAGVATAARAEILPSYSLRYLSVMSDVIAEAQPVAAKPGQPQRFAIVRLLKEARAGAKVGQVVELDATLYILGQPFAKTGKLPAVDRALLFMTFAEDKLQVVISGVRARSATGAVLLPIQLMNPGPYFLQPVGGLTWDAVVGKVQQDLPEIEKVMKLRQIKDPAQRNAALFAWIGEHRREFAPGALGAAEVSYDKDGQPTAAKPAVEGWCQLQRWPFDWIIESRIPADAWRAILLCAEVNQGAAPESDVPVFGNPRGRAFLVWIATEATNPLEHRRLALDQLCRGRTVWSHADRQEPALESITAEEQKKLLDKLIPLLRDHDASLRHSLLYAVRTLSCPYEHDLRHRLTRQALPALEELYRRDGGGGDGHALAEVIKAIGGQERLEQLRSAATRPAPATDGR